MNQEHYNIICWH